MEMRASLVDLIAALVGVVLAWRVMIESFRRPYATPATEKIVANEITGEDP